MSQPPSYFKKRLLDELAKWMNAHGVDNATIQEKVATDKEAKAIFFMGMAEGVAAEDSPRDLSPREVDELLAKTDDGEVENEDAEAIQQALQSDTLPPELRRLLEGVVHRGQ